jgi:nicotinamide-nucleotide amidase
MKAYIISIGDEILIGQILNTNAAWMATELNACGVDVLHMLTVSDERNAIMEAVSEAIKMADLVLLTGGLGPTKDDITKKTLADLFGMELEYHQPTFENIVNVFKIFGRTPDERYKIQSMMPNRCDVLINKVGTASGMWFEKDASIVVSMPGVPKEMIYLMSEEVLPRLKERGSIPAIEHKTVVCYGKGETDLSDMLDTFESEMPSNIKLAYLPNTSNGYVRLRLSGRGPEKNVLMAQLEQEAQKMKFILGDLIFGKDEDRLEDVLARLLSAKNAKLATAESCTGGNISHKITSVSGCSSFYMGSVIAYSNEVKEHVLGVSSETMNKYGAVSQETVQKMAIGAKKLLNADYVIASSGIAGPDGGTPEKPVGTIWIAIAHPDGVLTQKLILGNNRNRNIEMTSNIAINTLRLLLLGKLCD